MNYLSLEGVHKQFGKKIALNNVNCTFNTGITALLGPNGAGKSTMMNLLCTLLRADRGKILYNGLSIYQSRGSYLEKLSVQFQLQPMYKGDTALEYLHFCGALKGLSPSEIDVQGKQLLQQFGLSDTGKKKIGAFSGGMKQRLGLCGTFLGNPGIILLDEPSAGLDIYEREELKRFLCGIKQDRIIVVSTHIVSDIENIADHIVLLRDGQVFASDTQEALVQNIAGKIWEIPCDTEAAQSAYYSDGKCYCYSVERPCEEARSKKAGLTDVYFSCVKARR